MKKTKNSSSDKNWDILFDDQAKKGVRRATIDMSFNPDLYNKEKEGGWVYENDADALGVFKKAPKEL